MRGVLSFQSSIDEPTGRSMHAHSQPPSSFFPSRSSVSSQSQTHGRTHHRSTQPITTSSHNPLHKNNTHTELGEANIRPVMIDVAKADSVQACVKEVGRGVCEVSC